MNLSRKTCCYRLKPEPNTSLVNIRDKYNAIFDEYYEKCEELRKQLANLNLEREHAIKDLQEYSNAQVIDTPVFYWMRSRSEYVPAVISGVHYTNVVGAHGEIYVEVMVKGAVRKIHLDDICYEGDS